MFAIAFALLVQDAAETFQKIEEKALQVNNLTAKIEVHRVGEWITTHSFLITEGNKIRHMIRREDKTSFGAVSDGSRFRITPKDDTIEVDTPTTLKRDFTKALIRFGSAGALFYIGVLGTGRKEPLDLDTMFRVSDIKGGGGSITYNFTYHLLDNSGERTFRATLEYDSKTLALSKRTWTGKIHDKEVTTIETYKEYLFNQQTLEEKFRLPEAWQERYVGTASSTDVEKHIRPVLEREKIPYVPRQKSLGLIEVLTDTPQNARRARALLLKDAAEKKYDFHTRDE